MKQLKLWSFVLLLATLLVSCGEQKDPEAEAKLEEAGKIHDEAIAVGEEVKAILSEAEPLLARIETAAAALEDETLKADMLAHSNSITDAQQDYEVWLVSLKEVPGHEHEHNHDEAGHEHHEHADENEPAEVVLQTQKDLKEMIEDIKNRLLKAVETATGALNTPAEM
jgi:hypothetical protein